MKCCLCDIDINDIICDACLCRLFVEKESLKDLFFAINEISQSNIVDGMKNLELLFESFNKMKVTKINDYDGTWKDITLRFKRRAVESILLECDGDKAAAAKKLGITRTYIWRLLKDLGIE